MAGILIKCPGCELELEAPEEYAGQVVECPTCQTQMSVPEVDVPEKSEVLNIGNILADADTVAQPDAPAAPASGNECPGCNAVMDDGAVLCVQCGFHTGLGKKIETDIL